MWTIALTIGTTLAVCGGFNYLLKDFTIPLPVDSKKTMDKYRDSLSIDGIKKHNTLNKR